MWPASRLTGQLVAFAAMLLATLPAAFAQSPPSQGEAFEQGKTLGRTGNAAARASARTGQGRDHDAVEADFAARRAALK